MYKEANFPGFAFLSTLSLRRATTVTARIIDPTYDFYPRSPCGERREKAALAMAGYTFLSTLSLRRATFKGDHGHIKGDISIHALLAESDPFLRFGPMTRPYFYPRSPCGERQPATRPAQKLLNFYPRSPCGERRECDAETIAFYNFYPRSPCGERLCMLHKILADWDFYPRSPCGERLAGTAHGGPLGAFLSTLSLRRATPR